jgi:hypothetical protein
MAKKVVQMLAAATNFGERFALETDYFKCNEERILNS